MIGLYSSLVMSIFCGMIQGFPESWIIEGAVYMALGQIGNAVPPPLAYRVAESVRMAMETAIN
jgi:DNA (cytosine-5)-methyltransferase 1